MGKEARVLLGSVELMSVLRTPFLNKYSFLIEPDFSITDTWSLLNLETLLLVVIILKS